MKSKYFIILFFTLLVVEIIGELLFLTKNNPYLLFVTKPLLMPTLIVWAFLFAGENKIIFSNALVCALIFSLFGDIILMLTIYKPSIFIVGLVSFLITHIIYIYMFIKKHTVENKNILIKKPFLLLIPILYGAILVRFFYLQNHPEFDSLKIAIFIYATVILSMLLASMSLYGQISTNSYKLLIIGSILFVLSDTTIALSKFSFIFEDKHYIARIIIMILYGFAQFFIVKGYMDSQKANPQMLKT